MEFAEFKAKYGVRLDAQQEQAVQTVEGPVLLLAVPGSGKTTVLVNRIGYMLHGRGIPPEQILTVTYTRAAAGDMRRRYARLFGEEERLEFRTINGLCSRIIDFYARTLDRTPFALLEDGKQQSALVADLCRAQSGEYISEGVIKAVLTAITYVKNQMLKPEEIEQVEVEGVEFPPVYQAYCRTLRERRLMDYDDQMVYALQVLKQYPQILTHFQDRYRYFCVDEAQDTSKIQHHIIRLLAARSRNLFMVGDEDQSIYGFRAAYPRALTEFELIYPEAAVLYMEQNYRSSPEIVALADRFIQRNRDRHPKHMRATRDSGPAPREISVYDRRQQYRYLCKVAADCKAETAVLYRDNDSVLPLIDLLDREKIPYRCRQVDSLFFTHRIVRDVTDIIHLAQNPADGSGFLNIYYKLGAGIKKEMAREAVNEAARTGEGILECIAAMPGASPWTKKQCRALRTHMANMLTERGDKAVYRIMHYMGYGDYLEEHGLDANKAELLEILGSGEPSPVGLLERLEQLRRVVQEGSAGGGECPFILSTIHSSKGLEYERVYLMDVADGLLPGAVPEGEASEEEWEAYEEERRLFYVGMTRAKRGLALFTFQKSSLHSSFGLELFPPKAGTGKTAGKPAVPRRPGPSPEQLAAMAKDYIPGTAVKHKTFGAGTVSARAGDYVTVRLADGTEKKISLSVALKAGQLTLRP